MWVQPYCPDSPDKLRFSQDALLSIFSEFEIIECKPSIRPGSALLMLAVHIARSATRNKYANFVLAKIAWIAFYPFRWLRTANESRTAGAFYLIARKAA